MSTPPLETIVNTSKVENSLGTNIEKEGFFSKLANSVKRVYNDYIAPVGHFVSDIKITRARPALYAAIICAAVAMAEKTKAATYAVPADFNTIQTAIDNSITGDKIIVAPSTYIENINFKGKNITLRSEDPNNSDIVSATIIDGNQNGSVVTFNSEEDPNCVLDGLTITNGQTDDYGGGIYCSGSNPTITNCIISDNTVTRYYQGHTYGGGIFCSNSNPIIEHCIISNNLVEGSANKNGCGGGISCLSSNPTITDCVITDNTATSAFAGDTKAGDGLGGGIYCNNSSPTISYCVIRGNLAHFGDAFEGLVA